MISAPLKVAIVGKSPHSNEFAPWGDPSWEIWWIGSGAHVLPRWNRCFELHDLDDGFTRWPDEYKAWLGQDHGRHILTQSHDPRIPSCVVYPKENIVDEFGTYFNNSVSWAIAFAIHQGAASIGLWGVDMAVSGPAGDGEYEHQRPSCEYHLGLARGRGIDVYVHPYSSLLKCDHLYGFDLQACERLRLLQQRKSDLRTRIAKAQAIVREAKEAEHRLTGSLEQLQLLEQWS